MPLFMDRHDVSATVTAENVARMHQEDLKIQHLFSCRGLTYWFDGQRNTAFCLIDAPNAKAIEDMHAEAHGGVPNHIIEVESGLVEAFLGRIEDPKHSTKADLMIIDDPAYRTIMVIKLKRKDLVNHTSRLPESFSEKLLNEIEAILMNYNGSIVKQTAGYYLVSFQSVSKAIGSAMEIHSSFHRIEQAPDHMELSIGLSAGAPFVQNEKIFEEVIKLADRLCDVHPGMVVISSEVKDQYNAENVITTSPHQDLIFSFSHTDEKIFSDFMNYVDQVFSNSNITVHDFTRSLGVSRSKLYRKLVLLTGKSLNTFLREYRLDKAIALLNKNSKSISEIAYETGFTSPSYFSKCFHKKFGYYPSALKI